ncbi:MAG: sugar phosphate isomerase/epimerase family protein [Planctomycetota bacterium]
MLRYGYISNGFADHTLEQMIEVLAHFGYQGLGITLDPRHLDPFHATAQRLRRIRELARGAGLEIVIETGARYALDTFRKHRPSLVSVDPRGRRQRLVWYRRGLEIASELGAGVLSLWSGTPQPGIPKDASWARLEEALAVLLDHAQSAGVTIGFEPEPGMFVEDLEDFAELKRRIDHPCLKLTLDLGHLAITEGPPLADRVVEVGGEIVNVHADDVRGGRHEHLPLGEGEIEFPPLLAALGRLDYRGLVLVELSRDSHRAPLLAQRSLLYLRNAEGRGEE